MGSARGRHFQIALDAIHLIENQTSTAGLNAAISCAIASFGYKNFCFASPQNGKPRSLDERKLLIAWPKGWTAQYDRLVKDDPVARAYRNAGASFRWSDLTIDTLAARRVMQIAHDDFDMKQGFGVPIFGLGGFEAGLSFSGPALDDSAEANFATELIGIYAFNHYTKLKNAERGPTLTPRQREVMKWVAGGKTAWDISVILSVSQDTVNKTIGSAMQRLDVRTRAQAVAEAIRRREIDF